MEITNKTACPPQTPDEWEFMLLHFIGSIGTPIIWELLDATWVKAFAGERVHLTRMWNKKGGTDLSKGVGHPIPLVNALVKLQSEGMITSGLFHRKVTINDSNGNFIRNDFVSIHKDTGYRVPTRSKGYSSLRLTPKARSSYPPGYWDAVWKERMTGESRFS